MQYSTAFVLAAAATAANAAGVKHTIAVGMNGTTYTPNSIQAAVGDTVEFSFFPKNHTVTQSNFFKPCAALPNGFFSTFVPTGASPSGSTFTITINDTKPIWFYCSQTVGTHCQKGMVGAINAPATGNTFAAFQGLALASNVTTPSQTPPNAKLAVGGVLSLAAAGGSSSSASVGVQTVTATVTATVTTQGSTYTTTYPTTYTTAASTLAQQTTATTGTGAGSSTTSTGLAQATGGAGSLAANGALMLAAAGLALL